MHTTIISIDFDDLDCYCAIHGLDRSLACGHEHLVLERWLPRVLECFEQLDDARATLFVIGRSVEADFGGQGRGCALLRQAAADGFEIGHHSFAHDYAMAHASEADIADDLRRGDRALAGLGTKILGFRAPGYTSSVRLSNQVAAQGFLYDASALPSPAYYLTKLGVVGMLGLTGKRSAASLRGARGFFGRTHPHIRSGSGVWQIPVSVTPGMRLPFVGGLVMGAPKALHAHIDTAAREAPFLHLQLHALDFADPEVDELPEAIVRRQPELKVPLATRLSRLTQLIEHRGGSGTIASMLPMPSGIGIDLRSRGPKTRAKSSSEGDAESASEISSTAGQG